MKLVTKSYICGVTCFPGKSNCNNYCNHDTKQNMPDSPLSYKELEMEEKDMWENIIGIVRHDQTAEEMLILLSEKYSIQQKNK